MPPRIFVSYRRDDAAGDAGRLADHLVRRFGAGRVFLDIDTIEPGSDFTHVLTTSLQQTAAVLVVMGLRWPQIADAEGRRRLDDPNDFVRLEVETALGRGIPVVPVLVQGAPMPRADALPPSLAGLATRQAFSLDHAEFHADAERLCDRLAKTIDGVDPQPSLRQRWQRWWPAAVVAVLVAGIVVYLATRPDPPSSDPAGIAGAQETPEVGRLLSEASAQQRREQWPEALATLTRARALAPASIAVDQAQQDVAMEWLRAARVESGTASFGEVIAPALAVIDAALPSSTGARRADLMAHSGWASFLLWRDGSRRLNPADWYRDALALDPGNPYANAMLAHWVLFDDDDVPRAAALFEKAASAGRAQTVVRSLQWSGYGNSRTPAADVERVRLAYAMRRDGQALTDRQASDLWNPYYFALSSGRDSERHLLLDALPPDDHIGVLEWAFAEAPRGNESRLQIVRYYVALLHRKAGRLDQATEALRALDRETTRSPGSLRSAVLAALVTP